jgi:hypothetical protein
VKPDVFFPAAQWTANLSATSRKTCRPMTCSFALENGKPEVLPHRVLPHVVCAYSSLPARHKFRQDGCQPAWPVTLQLPDKFPAAGAPFGESPGRRLCRGIAIRLNAVFMVDRAPRGPPAGSLFYSISSGPEFVFHFVFHDAASYPVLSVITRFFYPVTDNPGR